MGLPLSCTMSPRAPVTCWELDAMSPVDLRERVANAIFANIDLVPWERAELVERAERQSFMRVMGEWRRSVGQ